MEKLLSSKKFQFGFTLIELLIVISIIVILIAIGAVSYTTAQQKARNGQRQSDLQRIATGLEEFFADNHEYPTAATWQNCLSKTAPCTLNSGLTSVANTYISNVPTDPGSGSAAYTYTPTVVGITPIQKYQISANLEGGGTYTVNSPTH